MINEDKFNNLYEGLIRDDELTTKNLNNYGFNSYDITKLIESGKLERISRGYYTFLDAQGLFTYSKQIGANRDYEKLRKCLKKCYEIDPDNNDICSELLFDSVMNNDYEHVYEYFDVLLKTDNEYNKSSFNFYLYLLAMITDVPDRYVDYIKELKYSDMVVETTQRELPDKIKIRSYVLQGKLKYAREQFIDACMDRPFKTADIMTNRLLKNAIDVEKENKNTLLKLAKEKNYSEMLSYLEKKEKVINLSMFESYVLKLVREIMSIQKNKIVPKKKILKTNSMFEAIDKYNYELALELSESYNVDKNINNDDNVIYLLLFDICTLSNELFLSKDKREETSEEIYEEVVKSEKEKMLDQIDGLSKQSIDESIIFENHSFIEIIEYLIKYDLDNAFRTLRGYLNFIGRSEYEFLIIELIKLSVVEGDNAFTKPMMVLIALSKRDLNLDIDSYVKDFNVVLGQDRLDEARIYLDIISKLNNLGKCGKLRGGLLKLLTNSLQEKEKKTSSSEEQDVLSGSIEKVSTDISVPRIDEETEREFIRSKYDLLLDGQGIILLEPMNIERRKIIHEIVEEYDDMVSFDIGDGDKCQIVLRGSISNEFVDIGGVLSSAKKAYFDGQYEKCIQEYLYLLKRIDPKPFVYAKLGLAYMKNNNLKVAVDYLTIAMELSKHSDEPFDFTELIDKLSGKKINKADSKKYVKMDLSQMKNDLDEYYGIDNIYEIDAYIKETGLDIDSACQRLGLNEEQIKILNPKIIITLGEAPTRNLLDFKFSKFGDVVGNIYEINGYKVLPIYHPSPISPIGYKGNIDIFEKLGKYIKNM